MTIDTRGDPTFGGLFDEPPTRPAASVAARVVLPDQALLTQMTLDDLERLLVNLMAEHRGVTSEELLEESVLEGSLRTSSVFMVVLINRIGRSIGQALLRPSDLDDPTRLRTLRGTAQVLKSTLERLEETQ